MNLSTMAPGERSTLGEGVRQALPEPRWPVMLAIVAVVGLLALLPDRITLFPGWFPYVLGGAVLLPIALAGLAPAPARIRWVPVERAVTFAF